MYLFKWLTIGSLIFAVFSMEIFLYIQSIEILSKVSAVERIQQTGLASKIHVLLHEDTNNLKVITASFKISGMLVFKDSICQFSVSVIKHNYQKQLVEESVFGLPILETQASVMLGRLSNKWYTWSQEKETQRFHLNHSQEAESKQWAEIVNTQDLHAWIDVIFSKLHFPDVPQSSQIAPQPGTKCSNRRTYGGNSH